MKFNFYFNALVIFRSQVFTPVRIYLLIAKVPTKVSNGVDCWMLHTYAMSTERNKLKIHSRSKYMSGGIDTVAMYVEL